MKAEIFWLPFLSASLLCAGSNYATRPAAGGSLPATSPQEGAGPSPLSPQGDAGPSPLSPGDAGPGSSFPVDAGSSISFPDPTELLQGDVNLDGGAFKALRVALEDLKPRNRKPPADKIEACLDDEAAYNFQVQKRGNLYFVSIVTIPERCDPTAGYFDGGVRYVISANGQILLKQYDGQR